MITSIAVNTTSRRGSARGRGGSATMTSCGVSPESASSSHELPGPQGRRAGTPSSAADGPKSSPRPAGRASPQASPPPAPEGHPHAQPTPGGPATRCASREHRVRGRWTLDRGGELGLGWRSCARQPAQPRRRRRAGDHRAVAATQRHRQPAQPAGEARPSAGLSAGQGGAAGRQRSRLARPVATAVAGAAAPRSRGL